MPFPITLNALSKSSLPNFDLFLFGNLFQLFFNKHIFQLTEKFLKNILHFVDVIFIYSFSDKVCFVSMLKFLPKETKLSSSFVFVHLFALLFFFSLARVIFFSLCFTCVETTTPFLSVLFFPSSSSLT